MARQARLSEHPAAPGWSRGLSAAAGPGLAARQGWAAAEGGAPGTLPRGVIVLWGRVEESDELVPSRDPCSFQKAQCP